MAINYFADISVAVASFFGMEFVARLMHKYLMHGILWSLHKDHHIDMGRKFQRNNLFGLFFAVIAIILFVETVNTGNTIFASAGFGMAMYGLVYLIVHDMIIHNSYIHLRDRKHSKYVQNLIAVHQIHHMDDGKNKGKNWGFLFYIPGIDIPPGKERGKKS
jgi:beta-carotene 3-hydroxylase